LVRYAINKGLI